VADASSVFIQSQSLLVANTGLKEGNMSKQIKGNLLAKSWGKGIILELRYVSLKSRAVQKKMCNIPAFQVYCFAA